MYQILSKKRLRDNVVQMDIYAPLIARKALPGQFVILRAVSDSERIPLTVADTDSSSGTVSIIFQTVGTSTMELSALDEGGFIHDFVGPLGCPTNLDGIKNAIVVGGGLGSAIAYPVAKKLHSLGCHVHTILGFRNKDLILLEQEFRRISDEITFVTDDGSFGEKALVTEPLLRILETEQVATVSLPWGRW